VPVAGFTTGELRTGAPGRLRGRGRLRRPGSSGHVDLPGPPRVGRYGVDLAAFKRVALPALGDSGRGGVVVVDELAKMELASAAFRAAVVDLLGRDWPWWPPFTRPATGSPMRSGAGLTSG
jgi:nucleoside-triphosphatase